MKRKRGQFAVGLSLSLSSRSSRVRLLIKRGAQSVLHSRQHPIPEEEEEEEEGGEKIWIGPSYIEVVVFDVVVAALLIETVIDAAAAAGCWQAIPNIREGAARLEAELGENFVKKEKQ